MHPRKRKFDQNLDHNQPTLSAMFARKSDVASAPTECTAETRESKHCFLLDLILVPSENECEIDWTFMFDFDSHCSPGTSSEVQSENTEVEIESGGAGPSASSTQQSDFKLIDESFNEAIDTEEDDSEEDDATIVSHSSGK